MAARVGHETANIQPGTHVGQYVVNGLIGTGGMAEVYEATHTGLGKRVAIKVIRREAAEDDRTLNRFLLEGQAAARVTHPNLVDVTDVTVVQGLPCLVMEYLEGESLRDYLARKAPLKPHRAVRILLPVVAGVSAAHDAGVIHRDLKPSNIFLTRSGGQLVPKVLDFGISKLIYEKPALSLTAESMFVGSPLYVSPEVAKGEKYVDGRCDQYSLGVVLYEAVCGVRPYGVDRGSFVELMQAVVEGEFVPPRQHVRDLPRDLEEVILRAMATDPVDRFPSLRSFGSALLPFADERTRLIWVPQLSFGPAPGQTETASLAADDRETVPHSNVPTAVDLRRVKLGLAPTIADPIQQSPFHPPAPAEGPIPRAGTVPSVLGPEPPQAGVPEDARARVPVRSPPRWLLLAIASGTLLLAAGTIVAVWTIVRGDPAPPTAPSPAGSSYEVRVVAQPESATISIDGKRRGTGALAERFRKDGTRHVLRVSAPGHATEELPFQDAPPREKIVLSPVAGVEELPLDPAPGASEQRSRRSPTPGWRPRVRTDNRDPWANEGR